MAQSNYSEDELDQLWDRILPVLGRNNVEIIFSAKPREGAFFSALSTTINAVGGPVNVTDLQIWGALDVALTVWPLEAEIAAELYSLKEG